MPTWTIRKVKIADHERPLDLQEVYVLVHAGGCGGVESVAVDGEFVTEGALFTSICHHFDTQRCTCAQA